MQKKKNLGVFLLSYIYMEMITKKPKKTPKIYTCHICDFLSSNKKDFKKHILTRKHKNNVKNPKNDNKKPLVVEFSCIYCCKKYKHRSGLSRHQKICNINTINSVDLLPFNGNSNDNTKKPQNEISDAKDLKIKELELELLKKDQEMLKDKLKSKDEIINILKKSKGNNNTNNFNNCNNKNITLNVYLNEHCKDAMNLTDFVNQIHISLEDLEYSKNNGFAKGITNILNKQLCDLNPTERPIHCSDTKRLQFYVKDEGKWEKEGAREKREKTKKNVRLRQLEKIKDWEENHPNWKNDETLLKEWQYICMGVMNEVRGDTKDIKKNLGEKLNLKNEIKKLN